MELPITSHIPTYIQLCLVWGMVKRLIYIVSQKPVGKK